MLITSRAERGVMVNRFLLRITGKYARHIINTTRSDIMFTDEELVKIHNILLNSPMVEVEEMVTKIRQYFKEQQEANKANEKTE